MSLDTHGTIVVKIGTSSLTDENGVIDQSVIDRVAGEVSTLRAAGHGVVVVSSGAISAGLPALGLDASQRPTDSGTLQAISSVGQPALLESWAAAFNTHGLLIGQLLLAPHNFGERAQYLHARSTLEKLHELGVVPLINENDAVTDAEIRYGDNDRIAALVANIVEADTLVLLTDTDGVLTGDPRDDSAVTLIEEIVEFDQLAASVGGAGSARGSGGMASKLTAAKIAAWSGIQTVIANAARPNVITDAVNGVEGVGTVIQPRATAMSARKLWIGFAVPAVGRVVVDDGARTALTGGGKSLLAVGVTELAGSFQRRDAVEIVDASGEIFAKGIARLSSEELADGTKGIVVHADDLVVIS